MNCPTCDNKIKKTHEEYWCSTCLRGYRITVDLDNLLSEITINYHSLISWMELYKKTNDELLEYAISLLNCLLTSDHDDILIALNIVQERL